MAAFHPKPGFGRGDRTKGKAASDPKRTPCNQTFHLRFPKPTVAAEGGARGREMVQARAGKKAPKLCWIEYRFP
jgi:hypothetical protein